MELFVTDGAQPLRYPADYLGLYLAMEHIDVVRDEDQQFKWGLLHMQSNISGGVQSLLYIRPNTHRTTRPGCCKPRKTMNTGVVHGDNRSPALLNRNQ